MKRVTEKNLAIRIGTNIKKYRKEVGMTSEALAYENDISKGYLSDIENGKRFPTIAMLLKISNALEIEIADLFKA